MLQPIGGTNANRAAGFYSSPTFFRFSSNSALLFSQAVREFAGEADNESAFSFIHIIGFEICPLLQEHDTACITLFVQNDQDCIIVATNDYSDLRFKKRISAYSLPIGIWRFSLEANTLKFSWEF